MADDKLEIRTAIDTDGVDDGMLNIKNLVAKGMDALNNSISGCISTVSGLGSALLNVAETARKSLLALGKSAVSVGKNFESSMSQVIATMGVTADTTTENGENIYEKLSEKAKEMGSTTKFSASEAADALNYLALAGYDAEKACDALPQVLNLAQAGGMDLARTSDLVTDAMSALGIDATTENLQHFGDVLAKTASKSNTSVEQLGDALLVCGGQAKMSGLELNEMATMLGIFADNGIKGSEGGTALRNLLKNMYTPTSKAAQAMEQLGISASDAVTGELRPVQEVLMDTMSAMESLSEADRMQVMSDIFDVQVLASASAALNNSSDRFNELSAEIANCDNAMQQMADTMNDNLEGDIAGFNSSLEGLGVEVFESLSGSLRHYVQTGTGYIRQLNDAFKSGGFEGLAGAVGDVLSQALTEITSKIPDILKIASKIVVSFVHGITSQLPVIRAEASGIMRRFSETIQENSPEIVAKATEMIQKFISGILNTSSCLKGLFSTVVGGFLKAISEILPEIAANSAEIIKTFAEKIINSKKEMIKCAIPIIQGLLQGISKVLPEIADSGIEILQNLINGVVPEIPKLMPIAVEIITGLLNGLTNALNIILEFAPKILEILINGIISALPRLLELAVNILSTLVNYLANAVTAILEFAPQILTSLIDGIMAVLPMLIECAISIIDTLISGIINNLEPILMACVEILMALLNGIIENITIIVSAAIEILNALISTITENLPMIISAAIEILMALLNGIIENLPMLIDAAIEILNTLVNCLIENLPLLIEAAIKIVKQLFDGIIDNLPQLLDAGVKLVTGLVSGLVKAIPEITKATPQIVSAIGDALKKTDWVSLGVDILKGIISGLVEGLSAAWDTITGVCESLWNGFKDFFDINSPSKLMRDEIGRWLLPGVAVGVEDTSDETADDMNSTLKELASQLEMPEIEVSEAHLIEFDNPENNAIFTQQIELLRQFSPKSRIPELNDERITTEIQSQFDEIMVTLNADNFISRFEAILSGMGNVSVPQYSEVYGQVKTVAEKSENRHSEIPQNMQLSPKISVFIGDTEIKDFVISAIDEANAVSGGVSV